ncbi:MAG: hypothetical protein HDS12_04345 [Bacteroides sp.]|nr:hypothetical protein [Bacteroides sp.]
MITAPTDPQQYYFDKYDEPRHHLTALLEAHIITLDIHTRILYPLADAGVKTVADLLQLRRSELRTVRNIGVTAAHEIEKILSRADLINIDQRQKECT